MAKWDLLFRIRKTVITTCQGTIARCSDRSRMRNNNSKSNRIVEIQTDERWVSITELRSSFEPASECGSNQYSLGTLSTNQGCARRFTWYRIELTTPHNAPTRRSRPTIGSRNRPSSSRVQEIRICVINNNYRGLIISDPICNSPWIFINEK